MIKQKYITTREVYYTFKTIFSYINEKHGYLSADNFVENLDLKKKKKEKLVEDIKAILEDKPAKVYAGISTRSIRIVSGERLLKEADEALVHAMEDDDCPVVGFRADAVKYRKFIETK